MGRPTRSAAWATAPTYTGGPIVGQPNKATPSGGMIAEGFDPSAPLAAEHMNDELSNKGLWIDYLDDLNVGHGFLLRDDFTGDTVDRAKWVAPGTGCTLITDGNAFGACQIAATAGTPNPKLKTVAMHVGAADFRMIARVRYTVLNTGAVFAFWLNNSDGTFGQQFSSNNSNWFYAYAAVAVDTGVAVSATYQWLEIRRVAGVSTWYIDGVSVFSVAYATAMNNATFTLEVTRVSADATLLCDVMALWVDRG